MSTRNKILTTLAALPGFAFLPGLTSAAEPPAPCGAVPTKQQVDWLRMEWYAFVHFGLNTYTNREWGYGDENPKQFNPKNFDANAIVATFKKAGMKGMIYTAKHHDGFCAWPTKSTEHNITKADWKGGKGDVVRCFADACKKHGIKFGTYLSPWDRNAAEYGRPGYLDVYYKQITELLTNYGPVFEIWFDGANGGDGFYGGAREKRNIGKADTYYNFRKVVEIIRGLQPDCIIWGAGGHGDVTWGGSEKGHVKYPCWNTDMNKTEGAIWMSLEGDTPINHAGWFWHPGQGSRVKSPDVLMQVYLDSVGRGANLILNVAPNRDGQLDPADVKSLLTFGENRRRLLATDYALNAAAKADQVRGNDKKFGADKVTDGDIESYWCPNDGTTTGELVMTLKEPATFDVVRVREQIRLGQRVKKFEVDVEENGQWRTIIPNGQSVGNQVMWKLREPVKAGKVRLRITESRACPCISEFSLLKMPKQMPTPTITRKGDVLNISSAENYKVVYTTDGSMPTAKSSTFSEGAKMTKAGTVKAAYYDPSDGSLGPVAEADFGLCKVKWSGKDKAAFDDDPKTHWESGDTPTVVIDLGETQTLGAFSYLPRQDGKVQNMTDRYTFEVSMDNKSWKKVAEGEFSNLRANPIELKVDFDAPSKARYVRFTGTRALEGNGQSVAEINLFPSETAAPAKPATKGGKKSRGKRGRK